MPKVPPKIIAYFCSRLPMLVVIFALFAVALLLSLVSLLAVDLDSATHTITIINIVGILVFMIIFGGLILMCFDKELYQYRDL